MIEQEAEESGSGVFTVTPAEETISVSSCLQLAQLPDVRRVGLVGPSREVRLEGLSSMTVPIISYGANFLAIAGGTDNQPAIGTTVAAKLAAM